MAIYLGIHSGIEMPEDQVDGAWAKYKESCENLYLKAHQLYYNVSEGKAYCITEAPSEEKVKEAHEAITEGKPAGSLQILEVQTIE